MSRYGFLSIVYILNEAYIDDSFKRALCFDFCIPRFEYFMSTAARNLLAIHLAGIGFPLFQF